MNWLSKAWDGVVSGGKQLLSDGEHELGQLADKGAHDVGGVLSSVGLGRAGSWVDHLGDEAANALDPELQLGQTDDPTQLIHGDPGAIRQAASRMLTFANAFGQTSQGLAGIDTSHWTGAAADAFRARYQPEPKKWWNASEANGNSANYLQGYADTVAWAQGQAKDAITIYAQGQRATASAVSAYNQQVSEYNELVQQYKAKLSAGQNPGPVPTQPAAFSDPGESLRQQAQSILSKARSTRDSVGSSTAAVIRKMTDLAPAEPSFWSQVGDDFSDAAQVQMLGGESFLSGIISGTAQIGSLARTLNPEDPWNITHPAEYTAGVSQTLAGVVSAVVNPQELVTSMMSGATTDPFEWEGKLVPQVALTLATAGGGEAADAAADAADAAVDTTPDFITKGVDPQYAGENLPGNTVWPGSRVVYLNETERAAFKLTIRDGKLYDADGNLFDTSGASTLHSGSGRAIFVVDQNGDMYAADFQVRGVFHHSSFLAGGDVAGAGEIEVSNGEIQLITNNSGHYLPTKAMTDQVVSYLESQGVVVPDVQYVPGTAP